MMKRSIQNWIPTVLFFGLLIAGGLLVVQCVPPKPQSGASLVPKKDGIFYGPTPDDVAREFQRRAGERAEDAMEPE